MKELFEQNKVLFLAVITALIIVFLVKKLIDYITRKGLEGIRLDVYKLFVEAEKTFRASKQGQQKFDYVIHMARGLLPKPIQLFVSESMLKEAVQLWFDGIKDLDVYKRQIYMMKSQDYFYYKKGLSTKEIVKRICTAWKLKLKYSYGSIKNKRIKPVQKNIGDMIVYVLNKAKSKLSSRYIFTIEGTTVIVKYANTNTTIYKIEEGKNVISIEVKETMDDIVTKIKIYGEAKKKSIPKLASVSKNTSKFGTIQEVMDKDKKEKLSKIKKQAQKKLKSSAKVKYEYIVTAISNPKIKRGDTVYVGCGTAGLKGNKTVKSITHDCVAGTMDVVFY